MTHHTPHAGADPAPIIGDRRTSDPLSLTGEQRVHRVIVLAFAPLHKAALGVATGLVAGVVLALVTLADLVIDPRGRMQLDLLSQYFYGYSVSPLGAVVGFCWAAAVGFVAGWFLAFTRNAVMAVWVLYVRARADWLATRNFLDYV